MQKNEPAQPIVQPTCDLPDEEILKLAGQAKNGEKFARLFAGSWQQDYPSQSESELGLCSILAFYTQDKDQLDRLFKLSKLYRPKWDEKHFSNGNTYGQATIQKALSDLTETYNPQTLLFWEEPISFDDFSFLPNFPLAALPPVGREMVEAVAQVNQVDIGLAACAYLGVLATALQRKGEVDLISHKEPLNLYLISIAPSGERKSKTHSDLTEPLYRYEREKGEELAFAIAKSQSDHKILEKRLAKLQDEAAKAKEETESRRLREEASQLADELRKNPPLKAPIYLVDDITLEALGDLMADQGERLGIVVRKGVSSKY